METTNRAITFALLAAILAFSLYFRLLNFDHTIENPHSFRQAQTASNIHFFIEDGLSIECNLFSKNGPGTTINQYKLYDVPFYQWTVAILCKTFGTEIIPTGRAVNLAFFIGTFLSVFGIMTRCAIPPRCSLITLFFFALSPLNIYYNRAVTPDNLAIFLGFLSLYCFLRWNEERRWRSTSFYIMIVAGMVSTLIKSVIYLPVAFTIGLFFLLHKQYRQLFTPKVLTYFAIIGGTAVFYRLFSNMINTGTLKGLKWETYWFFAKPGQRFQWAAYAPIIQRYYAQMVPPAVCMLFAGGLPLFFLDKRNWSEKRAAVSVMAGLLFGMIITIVTFLNVNSIHDYYQLPYVFIICFFAGYCADALLKLLEDLTKDYPKDGRNIATGGVYLLLGLFLLQTSRMHHYAGTEPKHQIEPGKWLQERTPEDAFILYVTPKGGWDPTYLYLAQREGLYVDARKLSQTAINRAVEMFSDSYDDFYLFVPYYLVQDPESIMRAFNVTEHAPNAGYLVRLETRR